MAAMDEDRGSNRVELIPGGIPSYSVEKTEKDWTMSGPGKLGGKDLKEYADLDVDSLLTKLSPEELAELNDDCDPDNSDIPASMRCKDQTTKEPTGPFQREHLLDFLEEKAKQEKDWDEKVPYVPGVKRGKVWEEKEDSKADKVTAQHSYEEGEEMAIELDLEPDEVEEGEDVSDINAALNSCQEHHLVDLAGILGMHSMLSQPQYYHAIKGQSQTEQTGTTFTGPVKSTPFKPVEDEPDNATDVEDCTARLAADDADLTEVNVNNMKQLSKEQLAGLIAAAAKSRHLQKLSMSNCAMADAEAKGLVEVLEENPSLTKLNVESNFLSGDLMAQLLRAALKNQSLVEFHAENQRSTVLGVQVEMDIMQSIEESESLLRVGLTFASMEARHRVSEALERNYEKLRLKRLEK